MGLSIGIFKIIDYLFLCAPKLKNKAVPQI